MWEGEEESVDCWREEGEREGGGRREEGGREEGGRREEGRREGGRRKGEGREGGRMCVCKEMWRLFMCLADRMLFIQQAFFTPSLQTM